MPLYKYYSILRGYALSYQYNKESKMNSITKEMKIILKNELEQKRIIAKHNEALTNKGIMKHSDLLIRIGGATIIFLLVTLIIVIREI